MSDGDVYSGGTEPPATKFVPTSRFSRWTFQDENIRGWVEGHLSGRVLNACAGKTRLNHSGEVVTNDLDDDIETDCAVDAAELSAEYPAESFETIVFDPPWSLYQSNLRYDGRHVRKTTDSGELRIDLDRLPVDIQGSRHKEQLGHARLVKESFNYLLQPGGRVIELTFHGTCMPARLGYDRLERVIFDPVGEGKAVIGSVDRKVQHSLLAGTENSTEGSDDE
jgi:hypothetical protein